MQHNQDMLERRGKEWGSKVRLIGLSIDQNKDKVFNNVLAKKWLSVEHYHIACYGCTIQKDFQVQGVPTVVLVDKEGVIVFKGHPTERNLEKDIDDLLEEKALKGKNCYTTK